MGECPVGKCGHVYIPLCITYTDVRTIYIYIYIYVFTKNIL